MTRRPPLESSLLPRERDALAAVDDLISHFAAHRRDDYFAAFAADATFLFHSAASRLESRAEYEALWRSWEQNDDFHVESCSSTERRIQLFGETAVFSHDVETAQSVGGVRITITERESIILQLIDGRWLAIHEHLSLAPAGSPS